MRDFKLPEEPDLLPENFQLDDPFAAEFIPEPLPGTKASQEEVPVEDYQEVPAEDVEEVIYDEADIPTEEYPAEFDEVPLEIESCGGIPYEDPLEGQPLEPLPEDFAAQEEPAEELTEDPLPEATDPDIMEENL